MKTHRFANGRVKTETVAALLRGRQKKYTHPALWLSKENPLVLKRQDWMPRLNVCYLFTHRAPKSTQGTRSRVTVRFRSNWNLKLLVFVEKGKPEYPEKNPRSRDENQQQTQPTYDAESENRTRATLLRGRALSPLRHPCSPKTYGLDLNWVQRDLWRAS